MKQVYLKFSCPLCGEPWAAPVEDDIDIHGGATFTCGDCGGKVIFAVEWPVTRARLRARIAWVNVRIWWRRKRRTIGKAMAGRSHQ